MPRFYQLRLSHGIIEVHKHLQKKSGECTIHCQAETFIITLRSIWLCARCTGWIREKTGPPNLCGKNAWTHLNSE